MPGCLIAGSGDEYLTLVSSSSATPVLSPLLRGEDARENEIHAQIQTTTARPI
jgi:hypothetical protein